MINYGAILRTDFFEDDELIEPVVFSNLKDYIDATVGKPLDYPIGWSTIYMESVVDSHLLNIATAILVEKNTHGLDISINPPFTPLFIPGIRAFPANPITLETISLDKLCPDTMLLCLQANKRRFGDIHRSFCNRWPKRVDLWNKLVETVYVAKPRLFTCELHLNESDEWDCDNREYGLIHAGYEHNPTPAYTPVSIQKILSTYPLCVCAIKHRMGTYKDNIQETIDQFIACEANIYSETYGKRENGAVVLLE